MSRIRNRARIQSEINVTPLIDVCLVLLVIFMVVTPLIKNPVDLPPAQTSSASPEGRLAITLRADGMILVGSTVLRRDQLESALSLAAPSQHLVLQADRRLPFGEVQAALRICRDAGFRDVSLATVRPSRPPST
ncbi:MAG TPA: biopolymer transporter ExbD [Thermoanaerobaculia bacterium]